MLFSVLFFITTFLHCYQCFRKRAWFLAPFIIGGFFEAIGYIGRMLSSSDKWALSPYIMQTLLLLLAPALYAASIYMILGRIIVLTEGERYSLIPRKWLAKIFIAGDVISFMMQGAGGGIMSTGSAESGKKIIVGGLFVQIFVFGFFVVVALMFQTRGRAHLQHVSAKVPWQKHIYTLYATSILILIRSVFRVVEYLQGNAGYLLRHEVFLYVFDSVLMLAVMIAMNIVHPGDIALLLKERERMESSGELSDMGREEIAVERK